MVIEKFSYLMLAMVSALVLMSGTDSLSTGQNPFRERGVMDAGESLEYIDMMVSPSPVIPLPFEPNDACTCENHKPCVCLANFTRIKIDPPKMIKERSLLIIKKKKKELGETMVKSSKSLEKDLDSIKQDLMIIKSHYDDGDEHHDECK